MRTIKQLLLALLLAGWTHQCLGADPRLIPVYRWYNSMRQDHALSIAWTPATPPSPVLGYVLEREEGRLFDPAGPQPLDTVPLHIWYSPSRQDFFSSTEPVWRGGPGQTRSPDYEWQMLQGYVYERPLAGTLPIYHWFNFAMGDNLETTDPRWENAGTNPRAGYELGNVQGYLLPPVLPQAPETAASFHFGAKAPPTSEQLVGERPAVLFLMNYADQPLRHPASFFDNWLFGPGFPNARDYMLENSQFLFTWKRGEVIQVNVPDDPDTTGNESLWRDNWDTNHADLLYVSLAAPNGNLLSAINAGGGSLGWAGEFNVWEQLALADLNGGHLMSGDTVAFKTVGDFFLRENAGLLTAEATSAASTSARFMVTKTGGGQIRAGDAMSLQCVSNGRYVQALGGGGGAVTTTSTSPGANGIFTLGRGWPVKGSLVRRAAREAARLGRFNPSTYDRDNDGHLTSAEMATVVLESSPPHETDGGGQTSFAGIFTVPGSAVSIELASITSSGEDVSFGTLVHEMAHQLGADDLYYGDPARGCCLNVQATLMSCTAGVSASSPEIYNLDPWHRMMFGWTEPFIRMVRQPAVSDRLTTLDVISLADKRPILLYDPARYDLASRRGEYLLLEYRTRTYSTARYDHDAFGEGLAIWQVKTRGDGSLDVVPAECAPGGIDYACFSLGQRSGAHGSGGPWTAANGRFTVRWIDGTPLPITFEVAPGPYNKPTLDVEWSSPEGFLPRLDSVAVSSTSPCYLLTLTGMFPINSSASINLSGAGAPYECPVRSWDIRQIVIQVPHGTPAGDYQLQVLNNGIGGNRVAVHLSETATTLPGTFQFSAASYSVIESAGTATLTVNRSGGSCGPVSLAYSVAGETAEEGSDFTGPVATPVLHFADGEITKILSLPILADVLNEDSETVRLTLISVTGGGTIGPMNAATLTLIDDDPMPSVSVADASITESDNASMFAEVHFELSVPSGRTVGVGFSTQDGTATTGADYRAEAAAILFPTGTTRVTRRLEILPDLLDEDDETFVVRISSPINATLGAVAARVTILDNDPLPSLTVNDWIITEGDEGIQWPTFTVRLSASSGRTVRFEGATANGTALAGEDYTGIALLAVVIVPGETTALVQVPITGRPGREPEETFHFRLTSPVNATLADAEGVGTIKELLLGSIRRDGADVVLTALTGDTGQRYYVQRTDSLNSIPATWTTLPPADGIPGTGGIVTFRDVGGAAAGRNYFYRLRQE